VPFFSVIIPTYNRAALLRDTLASVFAQRFTDYEILVVDDGSTDDTGEYLQSLGDRVKVLSQKNLGPGAARNRGARHATGAYLAFLDSDDLWFPWTLATFATLICQHASSSILAARMMEFRDESELASVREQAVQCDLFDDYFASSRAGYFVGAGMSVLRREELLKTSGYPERRMNAEDHDLILRMGTARGFVQVRQPVTLAWRRHAASATAGLRDSIEGSHWLLKQERTGAYPGGSPRARQRREIISRHVRPVALGCLRQGMKREGWELYRATLDWHVGLGRWKFLVGFPARAAIVRR